jgi:hypothetical protein
MSYVQVKVYLTDKQIEDAIVQAAKEKVFAAGVNSEFYVVEWTESNMDKYGIEATLAIQESERPELPTVPKQIINQKFKG